jgi:CheY-like chemotaxis protein
MPCLTCRYLKAKTGAEGLAILAAEPQRPPDLILLDASLPDMSGFEVCKRVRALYNKAEVSGACGSALARMLLLRGLCYSCIAGL